MHRGGKESLLAMLPPGHGLNALTGPQRGRLRKSALSRDGLHSARAKKSARRIAEAVGLSDIH